MFLAQRNLFKDKTRLALSIGGVALAVMLVLVLNGFLAGMFRQITSYLDHSPGLLATDPVCGMSIEREKAAAALEVDGTTYYFCSKGCRTEFADKL